MSKQITIHDKTFEVSIPEADILDAVAKVAESLKADYADKNPIFVIVLNGAFIFGADLVRMIDFPCQISFTKFSSYEGTSSTGRIVEQMPVSDDVNGRHVVIVEDIVETGYSMQYLVERLKERNAASIEICALSYKPEKKMVPDLNVKYVGIHLPDAFIIGYGLDYDHMGRNLRDIYSLVK